MDCRYCTAGPPHPCKNPRLINRENLKTKRDIQKNIKSSSISGVKFSWNTLYSDEYEYYDEYYDDEASVNANIGSVGESPLKMFLQQLGQQQQQRVPQSQGGGHLPQQQQQQQQHGVGRPQLTQNYPQQFPTRGTGSGGSGGPMLGIRLRNM